MKTLGVLAVLMLVLGLILAPSIPAVERVILRRMDAAIEAAEMRRDVHLETINALMAQPSPEEIRQTWQRGRLAWYALVQNILRVMMLFSIAAAAVIWFRWLRRDVRQVSQQLIDIQNQLALAQARTEAAHDNLRGWVSWMRREEVRQHTYHRQAR